MSNVKEAKRNNNRTLQYFCGESLSQMQKIKR